MWSKVSYLIEWIGSSASLVLFAITAALFAVSLYWAVQVAHFSTDSAYGVLAEGGKLLLGYDLGSETGWREPPGSLVEIYRPLGQSGMCRPIAAEDRWRNLPLTLRLYNVSNDRQQRAHWALYGFEWQTQGLQTTDSWYFVMPGWPIIALPFAMLVMFGRRIVLRMYRRIRARRRVEGLCILCGYALRGGGTICPEYGN